MDISKLKSEYEKILAALTVATPFVSSLLRRLRILVSEEVPTIGVGSNNILVINPLFWAMLDTPSKAWCLGHATLHLAFRDASRIRSRNKELWTISCDVINNEVEKEFLKVPKTLGRFLANAESLFNALPKYFTSKGVDYKQMQTMSKEELYKLLPGEDQAGGQGGGQGQQSQNGLGNGEVVKLKDGEQDLTGGEGDQGKELGKGGDVLQDGYPFPSEKKTQEEMWKDAVVQAYTSQKSIGQIPAGLRRIVDELVKAKVNWHSQLRQCFRVGMGKMVVSTYKRPSRKLPNFPGTMRLTIPKVHCLVDASGSISNVELTQTLTEIYSLAKLSQVSVVSFDAEAYEEVTARNRSEVISKVAKAIHGGGGTLVQPALEKLSAKLRHGDIAIIFSDGDIFDINQPQTKKLLSEIATKASICIFATTHTEWDLERWTTIKIKVGED